jgi:CBS domain containing-hemolysin-like protein
MNKVSALTIENKNPDDKENGLQIGFTIGEMEKNRIVKVKVERQGDPEPATSETGDISPQV